MKQLAIMKGIDFGLRDIGRPCLWFNTYVSESSAALQILTNKQTEQLLKESGCYSIKELEGKSCWVDSKNNCLIFLGFAKI